MQPKKPIKILNLWAINIVKLYQYALSPALYPSCRFYPSCSSYALVLLRFDNVIIACIKIIIRILKCNPFFHGGFAPPYIYLSQQAFDKIILNGYKQSHILAKPLIQKPQKITYFFVKSHSHLLKLKKFYIISIHL